MKYFIDTEFIEGPQKKLFGYTKPTIDLISIGIVAEDGREYYSISKDFNLKEAWNRYQIEDTMPDTIAHGKRKVYWIRENVLKPIFDELLLKLIGEEYKANQHSCSIHTTDREFSYKNLRFLIKKYGKSNLTIAAEIKSFCYYSYSKNQIEHANIEFYGYYADYDWVAFCWLFGFMINLPKGFPMYCRDLKQMYDKLGRPDLKTYPTYPKQTNEHNALADARWNKELYEFLISI